MSAAAITKAGLSAMPGGGSPGALWDSLDSVAMRHGNHVSDIYQLQSNNFKIINYFVIEMPDSVTWWSWGAGYVSRARH